MFDMATHNSNTVSRSRESEHLDIEPLRHCNRQPENVSNVAKHNEHIKHAFMLRIAYGEVYDKLPSYIRNVLHTGQLVNLYLHFCHCTGPLHNPYITLHCVREQVLADYNRPFAACAGCTF